MDRNNIIGFALIAGILVLYSMYNMKQVKEKRQQQLEQFAADSANIQERPTYIDTVPGTATEGGIETGAVLATDSAQTATITADEFGSFSSAAAGDEKLITLENDQLKITFSSKGADMKSVEVKGYMTFDSLPLVLFDEGDNASNLHFFIANNRSINTKDLFFTAQESAGEVVFRAAVDANKYLEKRYAFNKEKKYLVDYDLKLVGLNDVLAPGTSFINLEVKRSLRKLEHSKKSEDSHTTAFYKYKNEDASSLSPTEAAQERLTAFEWISFKQQFFNTTLISKEGFSSGTLKTTLLTDEPQYLKTMEASFILPFNGSATQNYNMQYYLGPNHYQTLKSLDIGLDEIVMVTGFMSWVSAVNKYLVIPVFNWLEGFNLNYGIIILILTLLIKIILSPLTYKSFKSMAMMKVLQPELTELKEKYKDDQQKFATEQWKLFQSAGVSPLGGCLPQLLQFPILIAMYYFFPASIELRQESFLWANDLSTYDSILNLPFEIPFYGDHVSLFTLLMTITSVLYAVTQPQMNTGQPGMKYLPYIFPIMLLPVFNSFPAALTYYYFLQNVLGYAQQWATKKFIINEDALHKKIQENKKKPVKKNMWQMRLEEVAKQQREKQKKK
ncbi:MAG: membrane protein insertase YidC [Chitinophagales bacterium]|nr:membrane protein insertase YidC [Chitinophagales bacterium]